MVALTSFFFLESLHSNQYPRFYSKWEYFILFCRTSCSFMKDIIVLWFLTFSKQSNALYETQDGTGWSSIKITKSKGPRIDPWRTLQYVIGDMMEVRYFLWNLFSNWYSYCWAWSVPLISTYLRNFHSNYSFLRKLFRSIRALLLEYGGTRCFNKRAEVLDQLTSWDKFTPS